jgi:tricorn protease
VFYLEPARCSASFGSPHRAVRHGRADYGQRDGRSCSPRGRRRRRGAGGAPAAGPGLFIVDADRVVPRPARALTRRCMHSNQEIQRTSGGWRNQRDYLYVPNLHGADWTKMEEMYGQILPFVNHRADLNYLLDNMGAEIAIGHSYVRGGDMPAVPANTGGQLGADFH